MTSPGDLLDLDTAPSERYLLSAVTEGRPFRAGPGPLGPSATELSRLHRDGVLDLLIGDVYAPVDAPDTTAYRAAAAGLVLPAGAVLAGRSAAWVFGVGVFGVGGRSLTGAGDDPEVDVIIPPGVPRPKSRGWLQVRQFRLDPGDCLELCGIALTAPVRTAVDLARTLPLLAAVPLLAALARATGLSVEQVDTRLAAMAGRRGVVAAKEALRAWQLAAGGPPAGQDQSSRLPVTR